MRRGVARRIVWAVALFILGVALVRVVSPARVTVSWETASEVDAAGFHLYRASTPAEAFVRINPALIPAEGDPLTGAAYHYEDENVHWGARYFYQLEEVDLSGRANRYTEIVHSRAGLGWGWAAGVGLFLAMASLYATHPAAPAEADPPVEERREESAA